MTALTAAKEAERQDGEIIPYKVAASTTIYKGALVCDNTSGYAVPAADTSGYVLLGVAVETVTCGTTAGAVSVRVYKTGVFKMAKASAAQTDIGVLMYVLDDATVAASSTNSIKAGYVIDIIDTSNIRLRIDTVVQ